MKIKECPECGSDRISHEDYRGTEVVICSCGYNGKNELDTVPEYNKSQKAKGDYSRYKTGGGKRSQ